MSIPFTQYLRPDGRRSEVSIERPDETEALAHTFIENGGRFTAEVLSDGIVSFTAEIGDEDDPSFFAIETTPNGPPVLEAVDRLVARTARYQPKVTAE